MLRHKNIDRICCAVLAVTLLLTCGYMGAAAAGLITGEHSLGYEQRLFDQSRVHTIDIVMDDWDGFLETCTSEEYSACTVVIDGEKYGNVAIRGKGNTSLSSVKNYGNDRYSFKIEFDHYQSGKNYHGLDKLCLNNLIQDKTYLKDYLAYTLMNKMGVAAPLCSFVQINVNGEAWGLYLAVEAVEDGFLSRNYGNGSGELYKPDSMSFGGGRGNGRDFDMGDFVEKLESGEFELPEGMEMPQIPEDFDPAQMDDFNPGTQPEGGFDPAHMQGHSEGGADSQEKRGGMGGGMGSSDVMLQYIDDDPSSYSNIFDNAKTDISDADQQRLIESLKKLTEGTQIESVVDTDAVIRYLVVHNFLCNDDSYTGAMVHNYYLYEEDGRLSMIPWDYNLAFGAFNMGGGDTGATSTVNSPIDSPVSSGDISSRPMVAWIFGSEEYTNRYHELYSEFIETVFESGWLDSELDRMSELLTPYVEAETRAFFTADEFSAGVAELKKFCALRAQSIAGQLDGSIPSTTEDQRADSAALVDASDVDLSVMGEFGMGGGRGGDDRTQHEMPGRNRGKMGSESTDASESTNTAIDREAMQMPDMDQMPPPDGTTGGMPDMGQMEPPDGTTDERPSTVPQLSSESVAEEMPQLPEQDEAVEQTQQTPSEQPTEAAKTVPMAEGQMPQSHGQSIPSGRVNEAIWMLACCAALLLVALLFAKFYRGNR